MKKNDTASKKKPAPKKAQKKMSADRAASKAKWDSDKYWSSQAPYASRPSSGRTPDREERMQNSISRQIPPGVGVSSPRTSRSMKKIPKKASPAKKK